MSFPARRVRALAHELGRLSPHWGNPERYFEDRSEIEQKLKRLARELEGGARG